MDGSSGGGTAQALQWIAIRSRPRENATAHRARRSREASESGSGASLARCWVGESRRRPSPTDPGGPAVPPPFQSTAMTLRAFVLLLLTALVAPSGGAQILVYGDLARDRDLITDIKKAVGANAEPGTATLRYRATAAPTARGSLPSTSR